MTPGRLQQLWFQIRKATSAVRMRRSLHCLLMVEHLECRSLPAIYWVESIADTGPSTLREAIQLANANAGTDTIYFNTYVIPPPGVILLQSPLPPITDSVVIDATTSEWYDGVPLITLNGNQQFAGAGLRIHATSSTVKGLSIINFNGCGIKIEDPIHGAGAFKNTIAGNYIGIDSAGIKMRNHSGVCIHSAENVIGGSKTLDRNVISGNRDYGIDIAGEYATHNSIRGNYIGLNRNGNGPLANNVGISITGEANNNTIGGDLPGDINTIASNSTQGIFIATDDNKIKNNIIGTNQNSLVGIGNGKEGVLVQKGMKNQIRGNTISGNIGDGIRLATLMPLPGPDKNVITSNLIGLTHDGMSKLGNGGSGVVIDGGSLNEIGQAFPLGNYIGGNFSYGIHIKTDATETRMVDNKLGESITGEKIGNRLNNIKDDAKGSVALGNWIGNAGEDGIALWGKATIAQSNKVYNSGRDGIRIDGGSSDNLLQHNMIWHNGGAGVNVVSGVRNTIQYGSYFENGGLGIDLGNDGVTENDYLDADLGPNELQNAPVMTSAGYDAQNAILYLQWSFHSKPNSYYYFNFYGNSKCDQGDSGYGEGEWSMFSPGRWTDLAGNYFGNIAITSWYPQGPLDYITVFATDTQPLALSNTSEFSNCVAVQAGPPEGGGASPSSGPAAGGTAVTLSGRNFLRVSRVMFGNTPATFRTISPFEVRAIAPRGTPGTVNIQITTPMGTTPITPAARFTYTGGAGPGGGDDSGHLPLATLFEEVELLALSGGFVPLVLRPRSSVLPGAAADTEPLIGPPKGMDWRAWRPASPKDTEAQSPEVPTPMLIALATEEAQPANDVWAGSLAWDDNWWLRTLALGPVLGERYHSLPPF